jgi:hypothetical protein
MNDTEFLERALFYQSALLNKMAEIYFAKGYWDADFTKRQLIENIAEWKNFEEVREFFDVKNLTRDRALALGFSPWGEKNPDLLCFPLWYVCLLPYGLKVVDFNGNEEEYSEDTDLEHRFGCVSFGLIFKE